MRIAARVSVYGWLFVAAIALGGGLGCNKRSLHGDASVGIIDGGTPGAGGAGVGAGAGGQSGSAGQGTTGVAGAGVAGTGGLAAACAGAADPRLVIADQRVLRLTTNELLNTVRYLIDDTEAATLLVDGIVDPRDSVEINRRFPPLADRIIDDNWLPALDRVANHVASYVQDNFATVTGCATVTDACATAYLDKLASRAYRRRLTPDEQARFTALYTRLRGTQTVNGYLVTFTVEEATNYAVAALLSAPQMLWRWELGDSARASASPAGLPLTDQELATQLAFFLTDWPPDDGLLAAANAGTLRANLPAQLDRLLASQVAKDWLRTIVETYVRLNQIKAVAVDPDKFPTFNLALASDMAVESRDFLDFTLWKGNLTDLLLSRTSFVNTNLAANIYSIPIPAGATATNFVETTLPDSRSGLLTNPAFLATHATFSGHGLVAPRGLLVDTLLLCMPYPGPDMPGPPDPNTPPLATQTAQEQVAVRASQPACNACHAQIDPYGLALESFDAIGRFRTVDDLGKPVDAHAALPAAAGGGTVTNARELAEKLAASPAFTNCMAQTLLRYALVDPDTNVEAPLPPQQAGCATADVVQRFQGASGKTFTDLVRATAAAPAFSLRRAAP